MLRPVRVTLTTRDTATSETESKSLDLSVCVHHYTLRAPCPRVAQNARGVVKGVVKGVTRASFGRRAPLTPQLKRASARRREEKVFMGVYC